MADPTPDASPAQPGPARAPTPPLKPGFQTSEFWLKAVTLLAGAGGIFLTAQKILDFLGPMLGTSAGGIAAVAIAGSFITFMITASSAAKSYTAARTALKQGAQGMLLVLAGLLLFAPGPARASSFLQELQHPVISQGPTFPVVEYRAGSAPLSLAAGAGYEVGAGFFQRQILGQEWDLLDLDLAAYGTGLVPSPGSAPTALSVAGLICTLSNSLCVGAGVDALGDRGGFLEPVSVGFAWKRNGFLLMAWAFNFDFAPPAPKLAVASNALLVVPSDKPIDLSSAKLVTQPPAPATPRANTINLSAP